MVISGGNFKPDTLKPKEVVSLLLDDDIEQQLRARQNERKAMDEQRLEINKEKMRERMRKRYAEKVRNLEQLDRNFCCKGHLMKRDGTNAFIYFLFEWDDFLTFYNFAIKYHSYPKSRKIDVFGHQVCVCRNPFNEQ